MARSPNYPSMTLGDAVEAVRPVFKSEHRNKMSRLVLAKHLGYGGMSGRALSKIGAIRAYGLIEGSGDELRVSDDAITIITAPLGEAKKQEAIKRCALRPGLFQELRNDYPDALPSADNLRFNLIQRAYTEEAAEKAAENFLATMSLVSENPEGYNSVSDHEQAADMREHEQGRRSTPPPPPPAPTEQVKVMEGERVVFTEEGQPHQYLKLIASGEVDEILLDAISDYVERQRKRLTRAVDQPEQSQSGVSFMITRRQREVLGAMGYSDDAIKQMAPNEAHEILRLNKKPAN